MKSATLTTFLSASLMSGAAIFAAWLDVRFEYRWWIFALWLIPQLAAIVLIFGVPLFSAARAIPRACWYPILVLVTIRFIFLDSYPFIAMHDEVRDGGLRALEIAQGVRLNIFATDWSQGLIFADICSLLFRVLGSDVRIYRIVGAFVSALDIIVIFVGVAALKSPRAGLIAAFVMGCLPAHQFFARTEPLISISSLLTTLLFLTVCGVFRRTGDTIEKAGIQTGLLSGLALGFHASVRPSILLAGVVMASSWVRVLVMNKRLWRKVVIGSVFYWVALLAAFGPQILFTNLNFLFGGGRFTMAEAGGWVIAERYLEALHVYFTAPLQIHFHGEYLLSPLLSVFLVLGIIAAGFRPSLLSSLSLAAILVYPLTNSALTDNIHGGQRLLVAVPPLSILIAQGVELVLTILSAIYKPRWLAVVCSSAFILIQANSAYEFFRKDIAERHWGRENRALHKSLRYLVENLKDRPEFFGKELCIFTAADSYLYQQLLPPHVFEFFNFFTPQIKYTPKPAIGIEARNIFFATFDCSTPLTEQRWTVTEPCQQEVSMRCPVAILPVKLNMASGIVRQGSPE